MDDNRKWFHVTAHTYGAWLHGDPRGFRTRHHREHIDGDYKNPPRGEAAKEYAKKCARSKESLKQEPVKLSPEFRAIVGAALRERLVGLGAQVIVVAMTATHARMGGAGKEARMISRVRSRLERADVGQTQQGNSDQGPRPPREHLQLHRSP